jgi:hypothetical protein
MLLVLQLLAVLLLLLLLEWQQLLYEAQLLLASHWLLLLLRLHLRPLWHVACRSATGFPSLKPGDPPFFSHSCICALTWHLLACRSAGHLLPWAPARSGLRVSEV